MWWSDGGVGWGGWLMVMFMMLPIWAALVFGAVLLVRSLGTGDSATPSRGSARRILDERFARGEIDADEYAQRREVLH